MCLNRYVVFNKYTGQYLTVDCGKCPDCLSQKASSQCQRIIHDWDPSYNYYFVTLTYANEFVPYVLHQNIIHDDSTLRVYRGSFELVTTVHYDSKEQYFQVQKTVNNVPFLRNHFVFGAVGVILWSDIIKFLKRLRKNGFTFSYYLVSEYGETFFRPHFHILFKTKVSSEVFKNAIMSCWTFCYYDRLERWFEPAISPQKYLSLYLSSNICLPDFYQISSFRPKKSHSLFFGSSSREFTLRSVFDAAKNHNLTYYYEQIKGSSSPFGTFIPLPSYVIYRYFPKFKGFGKLLHDDFIFFVKSVSVHDKRNCISEYYSPLNDKERLTRPCSVLSVCQYNNKRYSRIIRDLRLTPKDVRDIVNKVNRVYLYSKELNVDFDIYLDIWYSVSIILFSQSMRFSLSSCKTISDFRHYYFNINDFMKGSIRAPTLNEVFEVVISDDVSSLSSFDYMKHNQALIKLYKYNKFKKIKTHLL